MSAAMAGYLGDSKTNVVYSILCIHMQFVLMKNSVFSNEEIFNLVRRSTMYYLYI